MTDPTAPSDADLIARLRRRAEMFNEADVDHEAGELDMATADRIEALSAGNSRLVKLLDQAEANAIVEHEAWQAAQTESHKLVERAEARLAEVERQRDRAEQCIEQVREWVEAHPVLDGLIDEPVAFLAAYDAARETPEGV